MHNMNSLLFDKYKKFYEDGRVSENGIRNAVKLGLITQEECDIILGAVVEEPTE